MRQTEQERLADLEAKHTFQHRTLRAIRVVAENAPPKEARVALRAIVALARRPSPRPSRRPTSTARATSRARQIERPTGPGERRQRLDGLRDRIADLCPGLGEHPLNADPV
jgi:hypothetical protein